MIGLDRNRKGHTNKEAGGGSCNYYRRREMLEVHFATCTKTRFSKGIHAVGTYIHASIAIVFLSRVPKHFTPMLVTPMLAAAQGWEVVYRLGMALSPAMQTFELVPAALVKGLPRAGMSFQEATVVTALSSPP